MHAITEIDTTETTDLASVIRDAQEPLVMRDLVAHWPAVRAAQNGDTGISEYLIGLDNGTPTTVFSAPPQARGRFFYNAEMNGFNFGTQQVPLRQLLTALVELAAVDDAPALYAGATPTALAMPDFSSANPMPFPATGAEPKIWIGNANAIATHYDMSRNVACVVAGKRRFTLFPPEQIGNLYIGPVDRTPAGQPVSMVDLRDPDLDRYPRYAVAQTAAQIAELAPGDAIIIPPLWWHHVESLSTVNVLVNYWFEASQQPFAALMHSMLAIRELPLAERQAWRQWFDHYVFCEEAAQAVRHLPDHAAGVLGPSAPDRDETIRQFVMQSLARK